MKDWFYHLCLSISSQTGSGFELALPHYIGWNSWPFSMFYPRIQPYHPYQEPLQFFTWNIYFGPCLQQGKHRKTHGPDSRPSMWHAWLWLATPKNHRRAVGPVASSSESSEKCLVSTKSLRGCGSGCWTAQGQLPSCGVQHGKTKNDSDMRIKLHKYA